MPFEVGEVRPLHLSCPLFQIETRVKPALCRLYQLWPIGHAVSESEREHKASLLAAGSRRLPPAEPLLLLK